MGVQCKKSVLRQPWTQTRVQTDEGQQHGRQRQTKRDGCQEGGGEGQTRGPGRGEEGEERIHDSGEEEETPTSPPEKGCRGTEERTGTQGCREKEGHSRA